MRIRSLGKLLFWRRPVARDYRQAVGGHWDEIGQLQFDFLLSEGLRREHYILDVACGSFRAGRFFIRYLECGHYFGFDGDPALLRLGKDHVLKPEGLLERRPEIRFLRLDTHPIDFTKLLGRMFDFVWIHALFDHLRPEVTLNTLRRLAPVLKRDGRLYATIFLNPAGPAYKGPLVHLRSGRADGAVTTYSDREYWHHTLEFFEAVAGPSGRLILDACLDAYPHPLGLKVLRFLRRP